MTAPTPPAVPPSVVRMMIALRVEALAYFLAAARKSPTRATLAAAGHHARSLHTYASGALAALTTKGDA